MRLGRVFSLCVLLLAFASAPVFAWAEETAPVEVQAAPVEAAQDHASTAVHEEEGGGTMPQLDPTFYASQLFWLIVAGGFMYVMMSKVALPRVARVLELRDDQVRKDLEKAARLKQESEDIKVGYMRALRDADERARSLTDRTINEMREQHTQKIEVSTIKINQQITDTENNLRKQKEDVLKDVSSISKKLSETVIRELTTKAA